MSPLPSDPYIKLYVPDAKTEQEFLRLAVLGARPNTDAIVRSDWPWASPRLKVSRSSALICR